MVKISDAELEILFVLWKNGKSTSKQIIDELKNLNWSDSTIRTLIIRLINKNAITVEKINGQTYLYKALIDENEYKSFRTVEFINQLYKGSIAELLKELVKDDAQCKNELRKLFNKNKKFR